MSEITDDSKWTDGDFTIISSDNVRFKAPSYNILSASTVFADASGLSSEQEGKTVHLTDPELEKAEVVDLFLATVTNWSLPRSCELPQTRVLVRFLQKFDCQGPLQVVAEGLINRVTIEDYKDTFILFSKLDNPTAVVELARQMVLLEERYSDHPDGCGLSRLVAQLSPQELHDLPQSIQWPLVRALARKVDSSRGDDTAWEFMTLYLDAYPPQLNADGTLVPEVIHHHHVSDHEDEDEDDDDL